jgi:hypothetical protein
VDKPSIDNIAGWCEKGVTLSHARRLQQFEIADWLLQGTGLFPDATAAYDFAEQTFPDVARQTLINWVSVARLLRSCDPHRRTIPEDALSRFPPCIS